jgi:hypothetical protein
MITNIAAIIAVDFTPSTEAISTPVPVSVVFRALRQPVDSPILS